jgi:2-methylcitrate dehydratase PrpD
LNAVAGAAAGTVAGTMAGGARAQTANPHPKKVEGTAIKGATTAVRNFITSTNLSAMPDAVVQQGKRCLIDGFGVILAGSTVDGSAIVRDYVKSTNGAKEATTLGADGMMAPAAQAALVNGANGHAMDYDDTQLSTTPDRTFGLLTHPTLSPLCASLAVSERKGLSGAAFLEAFLVGFEVECKIAEAIAPRHYDDGFHTTGTILYVDPDGAVTGHEDVITRIEACRRHFIEVGLGADFVNGFIR